MLTNNRINIVSVSFKVILIVFTLNNLFACSGGSDAPPSNEPQVTPPSPLEPPTIINTQSDTSKIIIDWPLDNSINHYQLYWSTTIGTGKTGNPIVLPVGIHTYTHEFLVDGTTPLVIGTTYYYTILAVRDNKESTLSTEISDSLKTIPLPATPKNLTVDNQISNITVTWDNDTTVTNYNIYWSTTSGTGLAGNKVVLPSGVNFFKHEFLLDGTTTLSAATNYYYVVTAEINNIESLTSTEAIGRLLDKPIIILPKPPGVVTVTSQNTTIQLKWNIDPTVTSYNVYWATTSGAGKAGTKVALANGVTSFTHEFLADGTTPLAQAIDYYYVVTSQDNNGEGIASNEVTGRLLKVVVVLPKPPGTIAVTPQNSQIQLQWPLDATVTNYNVYWSTTSGLGVASNKVILPVGVTNYSHEFLSNNKTRLSNGVDFYYVVTSVEGANESIPSTEVMSRLKNKPWMMLLLESIMGL